MKKTLVAVLVSVALAGCAINMHPRGEANQNLTPVFLEEVAIVDVLPVVMTASKSNTPMIAGAVGGAALGGLLGHQVGKGNGKKWATAVGAIAGGALGASAADSAAAQTTAPGLEIVVRRQNGELQRLVQPQSPDRFAPGQKVRLIQTADGIWRVSPLPVNPAYPAAVGVM